MNTRRVSHSAALVALVGLTSLLVAACGGGSKKPPAPSASSGNGPKSGAEAAYRYSACMRSHGVSGFQDPHVSQSGNSMKVSIHIDPAITSSPNFKSAQQACAHILPAANNGPTVAQQHAREAAMLAFARCMRRHGFPKFPDPTAQGQLTLAMITGAGINLQQPAVKPAAYACVPVTHGLMTRANINQALANPNSSGAQSGG